MAAGRLHLQQDRRARRRGAHDGRIARHLHLAQPVARARARAKQHHLGANSLGGRHQNRRHLEISVQHRDAMGLQPLQDRGLLVRNRRNVGERLQMRRGHRGNHRHMRARHLRQRRDFAGMVHPDLDHRKFRIARHPRQCQRHAPVVVIAGLGGMNPPLPAQNRAQHFLGRGLAHRSGHPHHLGRRARPCGYSQGTQSHQHIRHDQQGRIVCHALWPVRDQRRGSPFGQGLRDKLMPIAHIFQRHKQIAMLQRARVDRHAAGHERARHRAASCRRSFGRGPQCRHVLIPSSAATATLACSTSSNG
ncbi:hypothetical protein GALL_519320 [mine drainage metagenome]|uniref:Uncharacterized protein n=1 Tax=mine drainage metagenome TaxID=410659 RepID=A0A1J5PF95_9ZZZZ